MTTATRRARAAGPLSPHPFLLTRDVPMEALVEHAACPVCGAVDGRRPIGVLQSEPRVDLVVCATCGAASASHLPTEAFLDAYYRDEFADVFGHYNDNERVTFSCTERFAAGLAACMRRHGVDGNDAAILDFGGQDGSMAVALDRALGGSRRRIVVVDRGAPAPIESRIEVADDVSMVDGRFGIVLASASLEHVPRLDTLLPRLWERVAPNGFFYARTPWVAPILRLFPDFDFGFPAHVHDLGAPFWAGFADRVPGAVEILWKGPSPVQADRARDPWRWFVSTVLKAPARLERRLVPDRRQTVWPWCGGWEIGARRA